jgi:hypothetical protein
MSLPPEKFAWMAFMFILLVVGIKKYEGSVASSGVAFRPSLVKICVKVEDFMTAEVSEIF